MPKIPLRVLIACEFSGRVRDAFLKVGCDAWSCDWNSPAGLSQPSHRRHMERDVRPLLRERWDLIIAHPPCTYLTNAGVRWLANNPDRMKRMAWGCSFFNLCLRANAGRICVENPIPHKHAKALLLKPDYSQLIQPWQFGHGETKATCLWLKNLPYLNPTNVVDGREAKVHRMSPGVNRTALRSITLQGVADAMAAQWGCLPRLSFRP